MRVSAFAQTAADEAAVRNTIEAETRAYHEANYTLLAVQWSDKPIRVSRR